MIKGLIFDLDGTLTLTQNLHYQALHRAFAEYGIDYTQEEDIEKYAGQGSKHTCERVLAAAGKNPTPEEITKCAATKKMYYDEIVANTEIRIVPGLKPFLIDSLAAGYKMIVATGNKLEATETILEKVGIKDFFELIVSQTDVSNQKPAPDLFLLAAKKMGLEPSECVVFEDALNGVKAAKTGNFKCIGLATGTTEEKLKEAGADEAIADYNDEKLKKII
jgi:beta-phosphoglucomutase